MPKYLSAIYAKLGVHTQVDPIRPAMGMKSWVGGRRVHIRNALWPPGILGVAGGLALIGIGAIYGLDIRLGLLPPSGHQSRFAFRL